MKKIIYLLALVLFIGGCATLSTSKMIEVTKTSGVEQIFNHPYKNVFYACEDELASRVQGQFGYWRIEESDIEKGIIRGGHMGRYMIIIVKEIEKNKILVKMQKFGVVAGDYKIFFKDVERVARRQ